MKEEKEMNEEVKKEITEQEQIEELKKGIYTNGFLDGIEASVTFLAKQFGVRNIQVLSLKRNFDEFKKKKVV